MMQEKARPYGQKGFIAHRISRIGILHEINCVLSDSAQFIVENLYVGIPHVKYSGRVSRSLQFIYIF